MQIILIRHGLKQENKLPDGDEPLSPKGRKQVKLLGTKLASHNLKPIVFFTSPYRCSKETADILKEELGGKSISLEKLKPYNKRKICTRKIFDQLIEEIKKEGENLEALEVVAFVGHYPSLWDLLWSLTTDQIHALKQAEAVCFQGTFQDFCKRKGKFEFRENQDINKIEEIEANRNHRIEETLRSKIQSKMIVSTFLAGFTFAVLNDILKTESFNIPQRIAAISMTLSLSLFIASVYMYAHMTTPKEYWSDRSHPATYFSNDHSRLHFYVKQTWKWVFTPAVILFIIGFIATLFNTGFSTGNYLIIVAGVVIIVGVIFYYCKMKPVLSPD